MSSQLDIFRKDSAGHLIWVEAARTHEGAKARILELAASEPAEYVVFDQGTGRKLAVRADGSVRSSQSAS
ncbi:MAG TPA: hypothetical protein VN025_06380 [Candidatus Dormibacteraeota bacterium]|jgi:hypothetical protein|nr:hypothetical protein [Candidatus Dormibacteraeota bacterium]